MKAFMIAHLFSLISGTLISPIVVMLAQYLKRGWDWLDTQTPWVKRGAVTVIAAALNVLTATLGVALPSACSAIADSVSPECRAGLSSATFLGAVVSAVLAMVIHRLTRGNDSTPSDPTSSSSTPPSV